MSSAASQRASADRRAQALIPTVEAVGIGRSLHEIASELNSRGVPTPRGGQWYAASVSRLLARIGMVPGVEIIEGDCRSVLPKLSSASVHSAVCSPPYWQKLSYGDIEQIGHEPSPDAYIGELVRVFREVRRVLRNDGTLWVVIGDGIAQRKGQTNGLWPNRSAVHGATGRGQGRSFWTDHAPHEIGVKPKDLIGIPWKLANALRNDGWYLRSEIIWEKPFHLPDTAKDRPERSHEYVFLLSKSQKYSFDHAALRRLNGNRSVWRISTRHQPGHPAPYPLQLASRCIAAGCPTGGVVLDVFAGSGTTGLAARRLGRRAILIESNPDYVRLIRSRIARGR